MQAYTSQALAQKHPHIREPNDWSQALISRTDRAGPAPPDRSRLCLWVFSTQESKLELMTRQALHTPTWLTGPGAVGSLLPLFTALQGCAPQLLGRQ